MSVETPQNVAPLPVAPPQQSERPGDDTAAFRALLSQQPAPESTPTPGAEATATGEDVAAAANPDAMKMTDSGQPAAPPTVEPATGQALLQAPAPAQAQARTATETVARSLAGPADVTTGGDPDSATESAAAASPATPPAPAAMVAPAANINTNPVAPRAKSAQGATATAAPAGGPATGPRARADGATDRITPPDPTAGPETGSVAAELPSAGDPEPDVEIDIPIAADGTTPATPTTPSTAFTTLPAGDGTTITFANRIAAGAVSGGERLGFTAIFPSSPPATGSEALTPALATLAQFASDGEGSGLLETDPITGIPTITAAAGGSTVAGAPVAAPVNAATVSAQPLVQQVAMQIVRAADQGIDHIRIRLHPHELGRVDVRLDIGHDGRVQAVLTAERADTLDLMRRDADQLHRALADGGLKADSGSLDFSLASHHDGGARDDGDTPAAGASAGGNAGSAPSASAIIAHRPLSIATGALDIRV